MITIWTIALLLGGVAWLIYMFNTLVGLSNRADALWADIDAQLKRRYELAGQLAGLAKTNGITGGDQLSTACAAGADAYTPAEKSRTESALTGALQSVLNPAAAHPQLKADEKFTSLQSTLKDIEDYLKDARVEYNNLAQELNDQAEAFPNSLAASMLGIQTRELFQPDGEKPAK